MKEYVILSNSMALLVEFHCKEALAISDYGYADNTCW